MSVNREQLVNELSNHGNVVVCEENNELSYVIVMSGWGSDLETFQGIVNTYVISDYPNEVSLTLNNGMIKSEYNK